MREALESWRGDALATNRAAARRLIAALEASESERQAAGLEGSARQRAEIRLIEAAFGLRALSRRCEVEREVPAPEGRTCDFLIRRGGVEAAFHLKRLEAIGEVPPPPLEPWERSLEQLPRGLVASLRRPRRLRADTAGWLAEEIRGFLERARVGEERLFRDDRDQAIARVRVIGANDLGRVRIVPASETDLDARVQRFRRLLRRACRQFLPGVPNVVLFGTATEAADPEGRLALADAIFGTPMERWDRFPLAGERVAHGRGADGFWHGSRHPASRLVGWFAAAATEASAIGGWWLREGGPEPSGLLDLMTDLAGARLESDSGDGA